MKVIKKALLPNSSFFSHLSGDKIATECRHMPSDRVAKLVHLCKQKPEVVKKISLTLVLCSFFMLLGKQQSKIKKLTLHQKLLKEKLKKDPMTGLYNHGEFYRFLDKRLQIAKENKQEIWLALIDVDHFKKINDTFGHEMGNETLIYLSKILEKNCVCKGYLYRYGGEEFTVLFPGMNEKKVFQIMEDVRREVAETHFFGAGNITISTGIARWKKGVSSRKLFEQADQAMYLAKNNGRNQTVIFR